MKFTAQRQKNNYIFNTISMYEYTDNLPQYCPLKQYRERSTFYSAYILPIYFPFSSYLFYIFYPFLFPFIKLFPLLTLANITPHPRGQRDIFCLKHLPSLLNLKNFLSCKYVHRVKIQCTPRCSALLLSGYNPPKSQHILKYRTYLPRPPLKKLPQTQYHKIFVI
jgi:hypothetical protein